MQQKQSKKNFEGMNLHKKQNPFALHKRAKKQQLPQIELMIEPKIAPKAEAPINFEAPINYQAKQSLIIPAVEEILNEDLKTVNDRQNFSSINLLPKESSPSRNKGVGAFLILATIIGLTLQGASIVASGVNTKVEVMGTAQQALAHLTEAKDLTGQKDFLGAQQQFEFAQQNFEQARKDLDGLGVLIGAVSKATPQGKTANALIDAGSEVSQAGLDLSNFYQLVSQINVGADGFSAPDGFYFTVNAAKKYLIKANSELQKVNADLANVDPAQLPENYQLQYAQYKDQLTSALDGLNQVSNLLDLFQQFIGNGPKSILVLFENNNELRPTGGFIGTYGFFKLNDGKITSQKISSVYDLDGQITDKIAPPGPFHDLTDHWGLRDSNWFADFSQSAAKASDFYDMTGHETPDAVVAVTPDLFIDLLRVTGPIYLDKYNLTLSADNFRDQVQLNTSDLYDKNQNQPKQMLADFAPVLLQSLSKANDGSHSQLLAVLLDNLYKKNLIFYDRDPQIEQDFENYNWAGTIQNTDRDYFAIYNANLGGKKTDLDVQQKADIQSEVQPDGSIINTVTYTRSHALNFNEFDRNIDYVRFLVPKGSALVSAKGFDPHPFYQSDGKGYAQDPKQPFKIDPDLQQVDQTENFDQGSGTTTGQEAGKTFFANWIELAPGESKTITLSYRLPFKITDSRKYSMLLQKQPGNTPIDLTYTLATNENALWYTPQTLVQQSGKFMYNQSLISDAFIGLVLGGQQ